MGVLWLHFLRRHDFISSRGVYFIYAKTANLSTSRAISCCSLLKGNNFPDNSSTVYIDIERFGVVFFPAIPGSITNLQASPALRRLSSCYCFENVMTKQIIIIITVQFFLFYFKSIFSSLFRIKNIIKQG